MNTDLYAYFDQNAVICSAIHIAKSKKAIDINFNLGDSHSNFKCEDQVGCLVKHTTIISRRI